MQATNFRSLTYRSGFIYNWLTRRLYNQDFKFSVIANLVGRFKSVFDAPCGTGYLCHFLDETVRYEGWDLNHRFLKKLLRDLKKRDLKLSEIKLKQKNIFDFDEYPQTDIIVFCDILHHIYPRHFRLVNEAKKKTNEIIICEPMAVKPENINAYDKFFKVMMKFGEYLPEKVFQFLDRFFFDNDGINSYDNRMEWQHDIVSLRRMYSKLGIQKVYKVGDDLIGIWKK